MVLKFLTGITVVVVAYLWITYVKRGPVYESNKSLKGKTVLITGGNSGIGKATVFELALRDARIIMASRNVAKSEKVKKEIIELTGNSELIAMKLDLGDEESVRSFAKEFLEREQHLDYLINNAAVLGVNGTTAEGISSIFKINHLGPFLLTNLLMDKMKSQASRRPVRIINVSSLIYKLGTINEESLHFDAQSTKELFLAYANSKLANILFTNELNKRYEKEQISFYSLEPGGVNTEIMDDLSFGFKMLVFVPALLYLRDPFYGCQTIMYCVLDDDVGKDSGGYFSELSKTELEPVATDGKAAAFLWETSLTLTGLD